MILMPEALTAENGAKAALIGEFYETTPVQCHECHGNPDDREECKFCGGAGELTQRVPVQWTTIKEIYKRAVALLGKSQEEAIAEAVAAERERCAKVCEDRAPAIVQEQGSLPDFETGEVTLNELSQEAFEAFENAAEAIRSAAK